MPNMTYETKRFNYKSVMDNYTIELVLKGEKKPTVETFNCISDADDNVEFQLRIDSNPSNVASYSQAVALFGKFSVDSEVFYCLATDTTDIDLNLDLVMHVPTVSWKEQSEYGSQSYCELNNDSKVEFEVDNKSITEQVLDGFFGEGTTNLFIDHACRCNDINN